MDELIIEAPGKCTLNKEKTFKKPIEDGLDIDDPNLDLSKYIITPYYDADDEAKEYGNIVMDCMNRAQNIIFNGEMEGSSSMGIGFSWGSGH
jgi:hypothetical protein